MKKQIQEGNVIEMVYEGQSHAVQRSSLPEEGLNNIMSLITA